MFNKNIVLKFPSTMEVDGEHKQEKGIVNTILVLSLTSGEAAFHYSSP
jgi:hypothetical protein